MNKIIIATITIIVIGGGFYYATSQNKTASVNSDGHADHTHDEAIKETMDADHMSTPHTDAIPHH